MSDRGESCELCRFFELNDDDGQGYCRRYPPQLSPPMLNATAATMNTSEDPDDVWDAVYDAKDDSSNWQWPTVIPSEDWCGEFEHR